MELAASAACAAGCSVPVGRSAAKACVTAASSPASVVPDAAAAASMAGASADGAVADAGRMGAAAACSFCLAPAQAARPSRNPVEKRAPAGTPTCMYPTARDSPIGSMRGNNATSVGQLRFLDLRVPYLPDAWLPIRGERHAVGAQPSRTLHLRSIAPWAAQRMPATAGRAAVVLPAEGWPA